MNSLILTRHAHSVSNLAETVNGVPPGRGLSDVGVEQARELGRALVDQAIDLGVSSRLLRTQETLAHALAGREVPTRIAPLFDEVGFGSFEGGLLVEYRAWAWAHEADAECPGGGETRAGIAARLVEGLVALIDRPEPVVLAVSHGLPIRYVLDAAVDRTPSSRPAHVPHATPFRLERADVERAAENLRRWAAAPRFADTPFGG